MRLLKSALVVAALAFAAPVWAHGGHGHWHGHHHGWHRHHHHSHWRDHHHHRHHGWRHHHRHHYYVDRYYYAPYPVYAAPGIHIVTPNIYIPLR